MRSLARRRDADEMVRRLRGVRSDSPRRFGRMTPHQMVCHLSDNYRITLGTKTVRPATGPLQRTLLKWLVLWVPLPWPAGIPTSPEVDQECLGTAPVEFARDLAEAESLLRDVVARAKADAPLGPHPVFGALSGAEWLRMAWLHTDHHLRQFGA